MMSEIGRLRCGTSDPRHLCRILHLLWHYFLVKIIFSAFSPILGVLRCYKRPDTFQVASAVPSNIFDLVVILWQNDKTRSDQKHHRMTLQ